MTKPLFASRFADVAKRILGLRTEAQESIQSVQKEMQRLVEELHTVQNSVCLEESAALIEEYLVNRLAERRKFLQGTQKSATSLDCHKGIRAASLSGDGSLIIHHRSETLHSLQIASDRPMDVLALLWGPAEVKAFAKEAALAAGAKPKSEGGLTADQALKRSEEIIAELERLDKVRAESISVWAGMQALSVPHAYQHQEGPAPQSQSKAQEPSVMAEGHDGVMRPYQTDPLARFY